MYYEYVHYLHTTYKVSSIHSTQVHSGGIPVCLGWLTRFRVTQSVSHDVTWYVCPKYLSSINILSTYLTSVNMSFNTPGHKTCQNVFEHYCAVCTVVNISVNNSDMTWTCVKISVNTSNIIKHVSTYIFNTSDIIPVIMPPKILQNFQHHIVHINMCQQICQESVNTSTFQHLWQYTCQYVTISFSTHLTTHLSTCVDIHVNIPVNISINTSDYTVRTCQHVSGQSSAYTSFNTTGNVSVKYVSTYLSTLLSIYLSIIENQHFS